MDSMYYKKYEPLFHSWYIKRLIGAGSFGKVYEIERQDFGESYKAALKAITIPQSQSEVKSIIADGLDAASATSYFRQIAEEVVGEFVLMSKLKGNSNIVSYEDHMVIEHQGEIGWDILIRMELLTPLIDHVRQNKLTQNDVIKLGMDMCRALELCQKRNIIHRDIKPENIFISEDDDFNLGDFGIARTIEKTTGGLSKKGTFTYMAPEIYMGKEYGTTVDIYSLGIVMYWLLNENRTPFLPTYPAPITHNDRETAMMMRIRGDQLSEPSQASKRLAEIVLKMCAHNPKGRYDSVAQLRMDLEMLLYEERIIQRSPVHQDKMQAVIPEPNIVDDGKTVALFESDPEATEFIAQDFSHDVNKGNGGDEPYEYQSYESIFNVGDYLQFGTYKGQPIKWIIFDCDKQYYRLICEDFLFMSNYNEVWADSAIRRELNHKVFNEIFSREQLKIFVPMDEDLLSIASVEDCDLLKAGLHKKQLERRYDSWLKEKMYYLGSFGWMDKMEFQLPDLAFGVRPICKIDIGQIEVFTGDGYIKSPYQFYCK